MNYGHFDADTRECIITRQDTPRAWRESLSAAAGRARGGPFQVPRSMNEA